MFELTLWLLSGGLAAVVQAQEGPSVPSRRQVPPRGRPAGFLHGPPTQAKDLDPSVLQAIREFPPYAAGQIQTVKAIDPEASTWKDYLAYTPFLTEMVAMWYVLQDPEVPNKVKLEVAAALIYAVNPGDADWLPMLGWADDAAFLTYAFWDVYDYITPTHVEQAKAWLVAHGVDPKPMFALHKEFVDRSVHPDVEDAAEVPPTDIQLPEKMGAMSSSLDLAAIESMATNVAYLAAESRENAGHMYREMEDLGRMVGYSSFPGPRSSDLRRIATVAASVRDLAGQLKRGGEGTLSKILGAGRYRMTLGMSELAQLAGAEAFGRTSFGSSDWALDAASEFSKQAPRYWGSLLADHGVSSPLIAAPQGFSRNAGLPTAWAVVVTGASATVMDGLDTLLRDTVPASVTVRAVRIRHPGDWVFFFTLTE